MSTWRDDPAFLEACKGFTPTDLAWTLADDAVAADRRIQAATLRAKIEALPASWFEQGRWVNREDVLAVLDAVSGGDS